MITYHNVQRGIDQTVPKLEVGVDTVYRRYNIHTFEGPEGEQGYEYDEDQMSLLEYLKESVPETDDTLAELSILFKAYQDQVDQAIAELSLLLSQEG